MKKRYLLLCGVVLLATVAFTLALYSRLPATVPTHWNGAGRIDRYGPRAFVFLDTGLMMLTMLLWIVLPSLSPKRFAIDAFSATYWHIGFLIVALLGYVQCVIAWGAYSSSMPVSRAIFGGLALCFGLLGNVMGKVRRNFWIGIRTPWTLASERVWYSTHRFAGKTMVVSAVLSLAGILAGLPLGLCLAVLAAGPILPVFYSLLVYKRLERKGNAET
jgi:uncharacterized membrane protein